jgi:glutathione peroxidase
MRTGILVTILLTFLLSAAPAMAAETDACPSVLNYTFNSLQTGKTESLCQFRGKVLLIVNTASYCGYTHQFEGLKRSTENTRAPGWSCWASHPTISAARNQAATRKSPNFAG